MSHIYLIIIHITAVLDLGYDKVIMSWAQYDSQIIGDK